MSTSKPFHHGDLKQHLIAGARDVIEKEGIDALSLRGVARHAGVSTAAPYRHFDSKEKLLAEVARCGFEELHDALDAAPKEGDPVQILLDQSERYIGFAIANRSLYRLMFDSHIEKRAHPDLLAAGEKTFAVLEARFVAMDPLTGAARAIGCWALVHGLASLAIDNQLDAHMSGKVTGDIRTILAPIAKALASV